MFVFALGSQTEPQTIDLGSHLRSVAVQKNPKHFKFKPNRSIRLHIVEN